MWKGLAIGIVALSLVGTTYLSAQPARERPDGPRGPAFSREDINAFLDARIAALRSGLQLTPDQERLWPAFEKAYRDRAKLRIDRMFARRAERQQSQQQPSAQQTEDPVARLQRRADALTQEGAALKALADAEAPLWQSFDDAQKRRFTMLSQPFVRQADRGSSDERGFRGGPPGRDGGRGFERGPRGYDGRGRDGDRFGYDRGGGRFGGDGRDGDFGRGPRDYGQRERDFYGERGFDRGPPRFSDEAPYFRHRFGYGDQRRGDRGGFGRDYGPDGGDYGRAPFPGRRGFEDRRWRDERGQGDGDTQGNASRDDEERL